LKYDDLKARFIASARFACVDRGEGDQKRRSKRGGRQERKERERKEGREKQE
jgi:hypothetical protein